MCTYKAHGIDSTNLLRSLCHENLLCFDPEAKVCLRQLRAGLFEEAVEGHETCLVHKHAPQRTDRVLQPHNLGEREYRTVVVVGLVHHAEP